MKPVLLAVAGFDPTGGAGLLLDIRVFNSFGWTGMGLVTAVTAQNTERVVEFHCVSRRSLEAQYTALKDDITPAGIKIGMLGCGKLLPVLETVLEEASGLPVVVDPVFSSGGGDALFAPEGIHAFLRVITGRATVITPNIPEAERLLGREIGSPAEMEEAARRIAGRTGAACFLKGGHLPGDKVDILWERGRAIRFPHHRIGKDVHGTGCFLSSSLLAGLASGASLWKAAEAAAARTREAIGNAVRVGRGQHLIDWTGSPSGPLRPTKSGTAAEGSDPESD